MQDHRTGFSLETPGIALEPYVVIGPARAGLPGSSQLGAIRQRLDNIVTAAGVSLPPMSVRLDDARERIVLVSTLPLEGTRFGTVLMCLRRMERLALRLGGVSESACPAGD